MSTVPTAESELSTVKRALLALQTTRAKLDALEQAQKEPIAIIGMGCRLPGGIADPAAFWDLLREGTDAIAEIPETRWSSQHYYDSDYDASGKIVTQHGGFLKQIQESDPQFFGISPREAASMDPQQHLLLEVCWEALENAGLIPSALEGSRTGVFIGICNQDYSVLLMSREDTDIDAYMTTGMAHSVAAGRLAYTFGFNGPCLSIDTACSSSLAAIHLACQSLRNRECDLAVTGGVNLILCPQTSINFSRNHMLSPDGRCKSFDASANGFGRGEGCGLVVLKRLSDVIPGQDQVLALIRGSAINQDGATSGLTVPNGPAQQAVIRDALQNAGVAAEHIDYVEAHGTGTSLGDPIEIGALNHVFAATRHADKPLIVGSVKTNLGHLEAAAGVSALMKVVLSLKHQQIPQHLHCKQPTPFIPWAEIPITVATQATPWHTGSDDKPRLAGVSSFGFSGTNVHLVLAEAPPVFEAAETVAEIERPLHILCLSARSKAGLVNQAANYATRITNAELSELADICFSANTSRAAFEHRLVAIAADAAEMCFKLESLANSSQPQVAIGSNTIQGEPVPVAWLFTGQGAQYPGMGADLYQTQPVFRQAVDDCAKYLDDALGVSLLDLLFNADSEILHDTVFTQPALFALEYAAAQMWLSWGVKPDAVIGHSVGEYVAACIASVFTLEDGLKMIVARARMMQALPRNGGMAAVFADSGRVEQLIASLDSQYRVEIAAINSSNETVISGERQALQVFLTHLADQGIRYHELKVSHAFHSILMEPMLAEYEQIVRSVAFSQPRIRLVSNLTGNFVSTETSNPGYWCQHIRMPVLFSRGIATLRQYGIRAFIEMGPHPVLSSMVRQDAEAVNTELYLPSMRKDQNSWEIIARSLSDLYLNGIHMDWIGFDKPYYRRRVSLPTYPFQRKRHWFKAGEIAEQHAAAKTSTLSRLLQQGDVDALTRYLQMDEALTADELKLLPKLSELLIRRNQTAGMQGDNLCYRQVWQVLPRRATDTVIASADQQRSWVIFSTDDRADIAQGLSDKGLHCINVIVGKNYAQLSHDVWSIDGNNSDDYQRIFAEIGKSAQALAIVYVSAFDREPQLSVQTGSDNWLMPIVHLTRAVDQAHLNGKLWLVTLTTETSPFPALLSGFGRSLFLEYPKIKGGIINAESREVSALLAELLDAQGEDAVSLHSGNRYVARLEAYLPPALPASPQFKADGAYLLTGGLGSLGLKTARFLAENGAGHLILLGRKGAAAQAHDTLEFIASLNTKVWVMQADVSDEPAIREVFAKIAAEGLTLKGVIHAAGSLSHCALPQLGHDELRQILEPKVSGAWILHRLTRHMALDFFVLYSSISSVLGTTRLCHYTAANGFLDGLADYRQSLGLPALSVNWGAWQSGGMIDEENSRRIADRGFNALSATVALSVLARLLSTRQSRIAVVDADWTHLKKLYEVHGHQPLLALLGQEESAEEPVQTPDALLALKNLPVRNRFDYLVTQIQELVAAALCFDRGTLPDSTRGFFDMGMDSLTAVELKSKIEALLNYQLIPSAVFDYPNAEALAAYLLDRLFPETSQVNNSENTAISSVRQSSVNHSQTEIQQLSDDELAALIDDEFTSLTE